MFCFELGRTVSVSEAVEEVKKFVIEMDQDSGRGICSFAWQADMGRSRFRNRMSPPFANI